MTSAIILIENVWVDAEEAGECAYNCRCPFPADTLIHMAENTTFYTKSMLVRVGKRLGFMGHFPWGVHSWALLQDASAGIPKTVSVQHSGWSHSNELIYRIDVVFVCALATDGMQSIVWSDRMRGTNAHGVLLTVLVGRLQRAVRAHALARRAERLLAVLMARHARLGHGSAVSVLGDDALRDLILLAHRV
jgi:hypothetical protein